MPTIFKANFDGSESIRYFHVSIVNFYLDSALNFAKIAIRKANENSQLRRTICAISFSAMTLEAFISEISEDLIQSTDKYSFDRAQKKFRKPLGQSSVAYKYQVLVKMKYGKEVPTDVIFGIEKLVSIRNMLVHYKLSDTAGKYIMPAPTQMPLEDGSIMFSIDLTSAPVKIEPPFLQSVTAEAAVESYNAVLKALKLWYELGNVTCGLDDYPELKLI